MATLYRVRTAIAGGSGASQLSTMYFGDVSPNTAQNAANAVHKFWDDLKGAISNAYTFQVEEDVYKIDEGTGQPVASYATSTSLVTGTPSGDPLPWATQGLCRWSTGVFIAGRQIAGRTFIPGMLESTNVAGVPDSVIKGAINTAASNLISDTLSEFRIYSRKNGVSEIVSGGAAWSKWAILTSRRD
jgi:hypothetical protein